MYSGGLVIHPVHYMGAMDVNHQYYNTFDQISHSYMYILGISAFFHDSAAALIEDGHVIAAAQEERFSRIKHDDGFPVHAIQFCLDFASISIDDLECIVFYDKPFLKFERLLETYLAYSPRGLVSFIKAMPLWLKKKIFIKKLIRDELKTLTGKDAGKIKILFTEHHLAHAASAYYPSSFEESAIVTIDGVGEWATTSILKAEKNKLTILKEIRFPHSIGLLYSAFTYFLGFRVNSGEYKLMGLAPYGIADSAETKRFISIIKERICTVYDDGSIYLNQDYFTYATGLKMVDKKRWEDLFGMRLRAHEDPITQQHGNLALAIQLITEEMVIKIAREAKKLTGSDNLCMAGGVALNCVANGKLRQAGLFRNIYIQPAAGDAGGSLGAALAAYHLYYKKEKSKPPFYDGMQGTYLGPSYSNLEIAGICKGLKIVSTLESDDKVIQKTALLLKQGNIVGWFQGRMEFGPRALGNRSILADPRDPAMQKKLNLKIKFRESFRPFAPAIPIEYSNKYFEPGGVSPYMLFVQNIQKHWRKELPDNYIALDPEEKLSIDRSDLPAITHVDCSARIQTVHEETNPRFRELLLAFYKESGCPVLVNTSFNVRGEPIVCTPGEAIRCFMETEMDVLVLNNHVLLKKEQTVKGFGSARQNRPHAD
jgi:carbamoyltransferase